MRGAVLSLLNLSSILLVSLSVLSTHVLWAQRMSTLEESPVQLPDAPSWVAKASEAQTHVHFTSKGLPLSLKQSQGQTKSWMRFFPDHTGYDRLSLNTNAELNQGAGTAEFWDKNKHFSVSAPTKWLTFTPSYSTIPDEMNYRVENLEQFGQRIPWAAAVILRIDQQAKAHPHITSVLKTVHPRF